MNNDLHIGRSPNSIDSRDAWDRNYGRRQYYHEVDTLTSKDVIEGLSRFLEEAINKVSTEANKASTVGDKSTYKELDKAVRDLSNSQETLKKVTSGSIKDFDKLCKVYEQVVKDTNKYAVRLTDVGDDFKRFVDIVANSSERVKEFSKYMNDTFPKALSSWASSTASKIESFLTSQATTQLAFGGKSYSSLRDIKSGTMLNFGMSGSSFESFKNQLLSQNNAIASDLNGLTLGVGDVADYLSTISSVYTMNTSYLQQNYKQLVLSNKYLKVQSSTIQDIARTVYLTGKDDILNNQLNALAALKLNTGANIDIGGAVQRASDVIANTTSVFDISGQDQKALAATIGLSQSMGDNSFGDMLSAMSEGSSAFMSKYAGIYRNTSFGNYLQNMWASGNFNATDFYRNYLIALQDSYNTAKGTGDPIAVMKAYGLNQDQINTATSLGKGKTSIDDLLGKINDALGNEDAFKKLVIAAGETQSTLEKLYGWAGNTLGLNWSKFIELTSVGIIPGILHLTSITSSILHTLLTKFSIEGTGSKIKDFIGFGSGGSRFFGLSGKKASLLKGSLGVLGAGLMFKDAAYNYSQTGSFGQAALASVTGTGTGLGGVLANTAKGALVGATFGPWGALIGGSVGLIANVIKQISGDTKSINKTSKDQLKTTEEYAYWNFRLQKALEDMNNYSYNHGGGEGGSSFPWGITSSYGKRTKIVNGKKVPGEYQFHHGVDFGVKKGTPFGAAASGIVRSNGYSKSAGNYVSILGDDGWFYRYYHQVQRSPLVVGTHVNAGDLVGYVGSTGNSTGPHLHFQVDRGSASSSVNPIPYVTSGLFNPGSAVSQAGYMSLDSAEDNNGILRLNKDLAFGYTAPSNTNVGSGGDNNSVTSSDIDRVIDTLIGIFNASNDQKDFMRAISLKNSFRRG